MEEVGTWRKASYSATNGNCVEVADAPSLVLVRDTTDRDAGTLSFSPRAWASFISGIKESRR
jgi:hypothetical protein